MSDKKKAKPIPTWIYRANPETLKIDKKIVDVSTQSGKAYLAEKKSGEGWTTDLEKAKERLKTYIMEAEYEEKIYKATVKYEESMAFVDWYEKKYADSKQKPRLTKAEKTKIEKRVLKEIKENYDFQ